MKVLLITYQLRNPSILYLNLFNEIKRTLWWHHLESTWIIVTNESPKEVHERLWKKMFSNDTILIVEIKQNYWGSLPSEAWKWLQDVFSKRVV